MDQPKVGFIGLGIMGKPMASNILKAGFPLTVWNRTREKMEELVAKGAKPARSPREVAENSEIIIDIVTDSPDVESVILGPEGVIEGARPGSIVIDMSTISPEVTRRIASKLKEKGIYMLDAPVSGGQWGAIEGTLSIMVGGEIEAFERALPIFQAMGKKITYIGPNGSGQVVKLCNQICVALNLLGTCEALLFGARQGIDLKKMIEAVGGGAGTSWQLMNLGPRILRGDLEPGFMVKLQQKDLRLLLETARETHLPLLGTSLVHQLYNAVENFGLSEKGTQALITALERLAQFEIPKEQG